MICHANYDNYDNNYMSKQHAIVTMITPGLNGIVSQGRRSMLMMSIDVLSDPDTIIYRRRHIAGTLLSCAV